MMRQPSLVIVKHHKTDPDYKKLRLPLSKSRSKAVRVGRMIRRAQLRAEMMALGAELKQHRNLEREYYREQMKHDRERQVEEKKRVAPTVEENWSRIEVASCFFRSGSLCLPWSLRLCCTIWG